MLRAPLLGVLALLAVRAAAGPPGAPPAPPVPHPKTYFESVDVHVVDVEVQVTDREGRRVPGLQREDFTLLEDGKPVRITNFYAEESAGPPAAPGAVAAPGAAAAIPAAGIPADQRLYLALFVDERSLTVQARNRLLPALRGFVGRRLRPGDRLLVARYANTLSLTGPTADPATLDAALAALGQGVTRGSERAAERRRILATLRDAQNQETDKDDGPLRSSLAQAQARETYQEIERFAQTGRADTRATLDALQRMVEALAGLPGRKALLLVSGGLAERPGDALYRVWQSRFASLASRLGAAGLDGLRADGTRLVESVAERANAHRVTFYALTAPEDSPGGAENRGVDAGRNPTFAAGETFDRAEAPGALAAETGGLAATQAPEVLLERLRGDLDAYYSLGYLPAARQDGRRHRLEVRVRDRSFSVRTRAAYRARTGDETTADRTLSALLLGEEANPLDVAVAVEGEGPGQDGAVAVTLLVKLPMAKLVLLPRGDAHEGQLRLFLGDRDAVGRISAIAQITVPVSVPNDQILSVMSQSFATRVTLPLSPGEHRLAIGVRDELGSADSVATRTWRVGAMAAAGAKAPGSR